MVLVILPEPIKRFCDGLLYRVDTEVPLRDTAYAPPRTVLATFIAHGSPVLMGDSVLAQTVSIRITIAFPFVPSLPIPLPPSPRRFSRRYLDLYRQDRSDWIPTGREPFLSLNFGYYWNSVTIQVGCPTSLGNPAFSVSQRYGVLRVPFVPLIPLVAGTPEKLDTVEPIRFWGWIIPAVFSGVTRFQSDVSRHPTSVPFGNPCVTADRKAVTTWASGNSTLLIYTLR